MLAKDRTFVVTGGAAGLGLGAVEELARAGAFVAVLDRDSDLGAAAVAGKPHLRFFELDVTETDRAAAVVDAVVAWTRQTGKPLGGVVNAAGVGMAGKPLDLDVFAMVVTINLVGTFNMTRLVAKHLVGVDPDAEGERGVIINVSSASAYDGQAGQVAYAASKGAVASMTLPLARDLVPFGIRAVAIAPSLFETNMTAGVSAKAYTQMQRLLEFPPRFGRPAEFALLVRAVVENVMLNGTVIRIDGATRLSKL
ncbi:NAD(P)-binding protein [Dipodascopsis tothii]|uniref:NAD(P)-binding protein n=1 Tax=Dipodascopsis tothii TaxID=44089 RepID=UPI0034CEDC5D